MKVKLIKLVNGIDLIAEILHDNDKEIRVKNPLQILNAMQQGIVFMDWLLGSKEKEINIGLEHIITAVEPNEDFYNMYNEKFGSGLVTVPAGALNVLNGPQLFDPNE